MRLGGIEVIYKTRKWAENIATINLQSDLGIPPIQAELFVLEGEEVITWSGKGMGVGSNAE